MTLKVKLDLFVMERTSKEIAGTVRITSTGSE